MAMRQISLHTQGFDAFKASLCSDEGMSRVDLVLSCVDNYEARMTINQAHTQDCWLRGLLGLLATAPM